MRRNQDKTALKTKPLATGNKTPTVKMAMQLKASWRKTTAMPSATPHKTAKPDRTAKPGKMAGKASPMATANKPITKVRQGSVAKVKVRMAHSLRRITQTAKDKTRLKADKGNKVNPDRGKEVNAGKAKPANVVKVRADNLHKATKAINQIPAKQGNADKVKAKVDN